MSSQYEDLLLRMLLDPPDPNEPLPPANQRDVMFGTMLSFLVRYNDLFFEPPLTENSSWHGLRSSFACMCDLG